MLVVRFCLARGFTYLGVNSRFSIYKGTIMFNDTDTGGSGPSQITTGVQTNITKTLDDKCFSTPARGCANGTHVICFVDEILQTMEYTATSGRHTPMNATLIDRFASYAGMSIDILIADGFL